MACLHQCTSSMNALLSNMIHQHKRVELQDLRRLGEGRYAATVKVNGMDVATDSVLVELMRMSLASFG